MEGMPELLGVFVDEITELLEGAGAAFASLRSDPDNVEAARRLHRVVHTLKTSAGLMGFEATQQYALSMERSLLAARKGESPVARFLLDALEEEFAYVRGVISRISSGAGENAAETEARMRAFSDRISAGDPPPTARDDADS